MTMLRWFRMVLVLCLIPLHQIATAATCDKTFAEIFRDISPSVVQVFSVSIDPFSLVERVQHGVGTGFVIDDQGHIATNAHLVHGASEVMVTLARDEMLPAKIVGIDPVADLAIIRIAEHAAEITQAPIGSSADLEVGEEVLAVGFPFGIVRRRKSRAIYDLELGSSNDPDRRSHKPGEFGRTAARPMRQSRRHQHFKLARGTEH
jgi:S1-C subfamily serine protease